MKMTKVIITCKPVNRFLVTSPAMIIAITKRKKSSEIKRENGEKLFREPRSRSSLEISIYELCRKVL